jgi:hypothetical protein
VFALKIATHKSSVSLLFFTLVASALIFSYQLRIFESPLSEVSSHYFDSIFTCVWNFVVTLNQVGYGDMYAKTNMGRFVIVIVCFWGMILVSFFKVTVDNSLKFSDYEEKSYSLLRKLN